MLLATPPFAGVKPPSISAAVAVAALSNPFSSFPSASPSRRTPRFVAASAVAVSNGGTRERERLKELFLEARRRCLEDPMDGVSFTIEEFVAALDEDRPDGSQIGAKVKGTVGISDVNGAQVDIMGKTSAYLPVQEACMHEIKHVAEAGIYLGLQEEFVVTGENAEDNSLILSRRSIQCDLAWERCRQLHAEDVVVTGKVVMENKVGIVVIVEGLHGFIPSSQISVRSTAAELIEREIPLKFVEVDEEQCRLILSNRKALTDKQDQLGIGSVVIGTVQSMKPYGAFVDIGGVSGLLHVSQISHDHVSDIATVLQVGDTLKVMIMSRDLESDRLSLSTKNLEPTPGDMIHNPKLVFEKADEMAKSFRQKIAQAEALVQADMLRFQPERQRNLISDIVVGPLMPVLAVDNPGSSGAPPAEGIST